MGYAADSQIIRHRFDTEWPTLSSPVIAWSYADTKYEPAPKTPYVRVTILTGEERQRAMGKYRRFARTGVLNVGIFVPVGSGDGLPKELADRVAAIFRGRTVQNVVFRAVSLERVGPDGAHVHHACTVPYEATELVLNPN